jgi:hypothetical protein
MKTLQEKYTGVKKGTYPSAQWLKEAKLTLPHLISPYNGFDDAVLILKSKGILKEEIKDNPKKPDSSVVDVNSKSYSYGEKSAMNVNFDQMLKGMQIEINKNPEISEDKARETAIKNLIQDPYYYLKNQAFGIGGIGYTEDAPGLKASKSDQMEKVKLGESRNLGKYLFKKITRKKLREASPNKASYIISKSGSKSNPTYVLEKPDGSEQLDMFFDSEQDAKAYAEKKGLKIISSTNETKLRSLISKIIKESYDYETQADLRHMRNEESLSDAIEQAEKTSREEGVVQHVNELPDGSYEVSDWYDADTTVFSFENGRELNEEETEQPKRKVLPNKNRFTSDTISIKSALEKIIQQVWAEPNLAKAKTMMLDFLGTSGISDFSKNTMRNNINSIQTKPKLDQYLSNSLLNFERMGIKESKQVYSRLKEIEADSQILALENKIKAIQQEIEDRNHKISAVEEMDMGDMINPTKVKEIQKEIKLLEKEKSKMEKIMEKLSKKGKKKVVTSADKDKDMVPDSQDIVDENLDWEDEDYESESRKIEYGIDPELGDEDMDDLD